jgi:hypothetical protein
MESPDGEGVYVKVISISDVRKGDPEILMLSMKSSVMIPTDLFLRLVTKRRSPLGPILI